ncbi:MAG: thiamine-phosphate kinase [Maricaulaceae bacterium]|jgi:thiamine-monophosphate kinase
MDEFEFIRELLAPLAGAGARDLTDDAGTLAPPEGMELVATADVLVAGVHFRAADPIETVAHKALAVNVSDLIAKGAEPQSYLLSVVWPRGMSLDEKRKFVAGLSTAQELFGVALLGGDTTAADGPLTLAVTALGLVPKSEFVPRSGAKVGDVVFVTGAIGDGGLGLRAAESALGALSDEDRAYLVEQYQCPKPVPALAEALRRRATAAIDVSDGLLADAGHVARTSGVRLRIDAEAIPLSAAGTAWRDCQPNAARAVAELATSGDDYEVMFCGPEAIGEEIASASDVRVSRIGTVVKGEGAVLIDAAGGEIEITRPGFVHF